MEVKTHRLKMAGQEITVNSTESAEYMNELAEIVDASICKVLESEVRATPFMAILLTAVEFCDDARKAQQNVDNMRAQMKAYIEDSNHAREEFNECKRELIRVQKEYDKLLLEYNNTINKKANNS